MTVEVGGEVTGELARPWQPMIGSEHLSYLMRRDRTGGRVIGAELREALRIARDELGVRAVRAHGILCDDLGVYREGRAPDFGGIDRVYDELMALGLRPVVGLSFMPRDLARDPGQTVFSYQACHLAAEGLGPLGQPGRRPGRPPGPALRRRRGRAATGRSRYGTSRTSTCSGPAPSRSTSGCTTCPHARSSPCTPGCGSAGPRRRRRLDPELLAHLDASGAPLDFLSSHVYGNVPLDLRTGEPPAQGRVWWTEWGVTPTHFNRVGDTVFAAAFLLRGMVSALGRVGALSHWVASDHFEELGAPPELFHGGFGLLSVGNLRKPRYWALALLAGMGRHRLGVEVTGDGAGGLVEALAARHDDGRTGILVWNGSLDQGKMAGDAQLDREVRLRVHVSPGTSYTARHYRIDAEHSNIVAAWEKLRDGAGGPDRTAWPRDGQWRTLREMNALDELEPPARVTAGNGLLELAFGLPMPGVSYLELAP